MSPRKRKPIDPNTTDPQERFALHLRAILDKHGWSSQEFAERCQQHGVQVDARAVDSWLRAQYMPKSRDLLLIGEAAGLKDPRHILPRPTK